MKCLGVHPVFKDYILPAYLKFFHKILGAVQMRSYEHNLHFFKSLKHFYNTLEVYVRT